MRVLQLIDSLETGGAERVAVNIANALSKEIEFSAICATRKEGLLKTEIHPNVDYVFLSKTRILDIKAIIQLLKYINQQQIQVIHAHSTSFFLASIVKLLNGKVKIVWHDHYGNAEFLNQRKHKVLKFCSKMFSHIFTVNTTLETWAKTNLHHKSVSYLPNFAVLNKTLKETNLKGEEGKRILCLANFRAQKDHITLINAFKIVNEKHQDWTLHCVGKMFEDECFDKIEAEIKTLNLENAVFLYEQKPDVYHILSQCEIGVLSSKSEGLPISLLEYGLANLAVVVTDVGENAKVVDHGRNGQVVCSGAINELSKALSFYIENKGERLKQADYFTKHIDTNYSEKSQVSTIINTYKNILD